MRRSTSLFFFLVSGCSCSTPIGTDGDAGVEIDASTLDASAPDAGDAGFTRRDAGCAEGTLGPWVMETYDDVSVVYRARITPSLGGEPFDLFLESRRFVASEFTGTFPLGAGDDANYGSCSHCVVAFTGSRFDRGFFASSGTLVLDRDPYDLALSGSLSDVTLVEVTIDATLASTPVPGGDCVHLASETFDETFGPPGWTCDLAAFEDGTTCHCGCGILDRDCALDELPVVGCDPGQICLPLAEGIIGPFFGRSTCANECDRATGVACPAPEACVDHAFGDLCIADATLLDARADLGDVCVDGALHCAIDADGFSNGYCDRFDRADDRCRPRCSVDSDCDALAFEHCYVVTYEWMDDGSETPRGYCAPAFPTTWTCGGDTYRDGATCDCGCGDLDPDCEDGSLPIVGCAAGETCPGGRCNP